MLDSVLLQRPSLLFIANCQLPIANLQVFRRCSYFRHSSEFFVPVRQLAIVFRVLFNWRMKQRLYLGGSKIVRRNHRHACVEPFLNSLAL